MATVEDASRCPKCDKPGEHVRERRVGGSPNRVVDVYCRNELCKWLNTSWIIEIRPDGTVPDPQLGRRPMTYVPDPNADAIAAQIHDALMADRKAQQQPGTEVRNPNSL